MATAGGYDPKKIENEIYALWENGGHFHAEPDAGRVPYVITIPPPNVTGALHLGHALNNTLQDMLIRRKRMQGFNACWLPGTDHAGIATQAVVEKRLREEQGWKRDSSNPEHRTFLVGKINEWKDEYKARILGQLKRMGCSCDWQRERFTLDEQCAKAVYETFFRFFKDGLIYRGLRLVNWDTQLQTAVADDEVYHETVRGNLWHIRYLISRHEGTEARRHEGTEARRHGGTEERGRDYLCVATTRPETMLADTAVAVHPDDERYRHLHGGQGAAPTHFVMLPLMNRAIPIVADGMLVKKEFGTGCVKVTPGHDPNDHACYQRKLGQADQIGVRDLLTPDGKIRSDYGAYSGMKKEDARKKVVADLEALGLLEKIEPYETEVGHSDRSKTPIEPLRSEQWFVAMDKPGAPRLAESAMDAVRDGRVRFFPERYAKTYLDWLGEKRDWCISRQLWWGHRIPVWRRRMLLSELFADTGDFRALVEVSTSDDATVISIKEPGTGAAWHDINGRWSLAENLPDSSSWAALQCEYTRGDREVIVEICFRDYPNRNGADQHLGEQDPSGGLSHRAHVDRCIQFAEGAGFAQDPDVLDTWFSSALWPHSTFGWPADEARTHTGTEARRHEGTQARSEEKKVVSSPSVPSCLRASVPTCPRASVPTCPRACVPSEIEYFYPTSVLSTAREIITLWVARMVMTGLYNIGRVPFQHVYIHAVIQDGQGRRMSKSAGNGVDPLDIIDVYGADALRFSLAQLATETQDIRIPVKPAQLADGRTVNTSERFELGRNFCNKVYQAAAGFVFPNIDGATPRPLSPSDLAIEDRWILSRLRTTIETVDRCLDGYQFAESVQTLYSFFWSDFCDWYVELAKPRLADRDAAGESVRREDASAASARQVLAWVLDQSLRLLHPAIPFVTEAVWRELNRAAPLRGIAELRACDTPLIVSRWPSAGDSPRDAESERQIGPMQGVIGALREIRTSLNAIRSQAKQAALRSLPAAVVRCDESTAALLERGLPAITRLGQVEQISFGPAVAKPPQSLSKLLSGIEVYVPIAGLADMEVERTRLSKDRAEVSLAIQRLEGKLANEGFVAKAKPEVIESERARLVELRDKLATIERNWAELGG